jgi:hypothetical protein
MENDSKKYGLPRPGDMKDHDSQKIYEKNAQRAENHGPFKYCAGVGSAGGN